jgi:transcription antitermination protein NusB
MTAADRDEAAAPAPARRPGVRRPADGSARSARRRAREFALQGLYGWLLAGGEGAPIAERFKASPGYAQADEAYFLELLNGAIGAAESLRAHFAAAIDRPLAELSPVEHSILMIATYELIHRPEIPYRVVINEAVELAKNFGASEGYRYVNGVLDKLAGRLRPAESSRSAGAR